MRFANCKKGQAAAFQNDRLWPLAAIRLDVYSTTGNDPKQPSGKRSESLEILLNVDDRDRNRKVTADELLAAAASLGVLFVPIFLVVAFPENSTVATLFGGGRIFVFWAVIFGLVFIFRRKIDRLSADWARKRDQGRD